MPRKASLIKPIDASFEQVMKVLLNVPEKKQLSSRPPTVRGALLAKKKRLEKQLAEVNKALKD
jgi:phage-related protein